MDNYRKIFYDEYKKTASMPSKAGFVAWLDDNKYLMVLCDEYLKTGDSPSYLGYKRWLDTKKNTLPLYEKFLESMDMFPNRGIVEIGKSNSDSVLLYTPSETKGILVSKYVKTEKTKKDNIVNCNGEILIDDKTVNLFYSDKMVSLEKMGNYIITLPSKEDEIEVAKELFTTNNNVFLGIYGNNADKDRETKLKELYSIKEELEAFTGKDFIGEITSTNNYYLASITKRLKYKGK